MKKIFLLIPAAVLVFVALYAFRDKGSETDSDKTLTKREYSILTVLFQQHSAEYRALCLQAYNIARMQLDMKLKSKPSNPAIITDIDETVLDNSPFQAGNILDNTDYNTVLWHKWCSEARAGSVPGAVEFMKYAASKGVSIYYVSNRDTSDVRATMKNLADQGFPQITNEHFSFKAGKVGSKRSRQNLIAEKHKVLLLLGDNLNDFSYVFESRNTADRKGVVDSLKSSFGDNFIMIPNAMYGEWESALYNYNFKLTEAAKDSVRKSLLIR
jgi:5'-nucleotidase (lipoprotein e(P4) family)